MRRIAVACLILTPVVGCTRNAVSVAGNSPSVTDGGVAASADAAMSPADFATPRRDAAAPPRDAAAPPLDAGPSRDAGGVDAAPPPDFAIGPQGVACPARTGAPDAGACSPYGISCGLSVPAFAVDGTDVYLGTWYWTRGVYRLRDGWLTPLAPLTFQPTAMVVDADAVYVAGDELLRIPKSGAAPTVLATSSPPWWLRADRDTLFWASHWNDPAIHAVSKTGGSPRVIATESQIIGGLDIAGDDVYWAAYDAHDVGSAIRRAPKAGGAVETVFADPAMAEIGPMMFAPDGTLFFVDVRSTALVELDVATGQIVRVPSLVPGGSGGVSASALAVDDDVAYWAVFWHEGDGPGSEVLDFRLDRHSGTVTRVGLDLWRPSLLAGSWIYAGNGDSIVRACK